MSVTLYYVVGGNDCHYENLRLSVNSVRKLTDTPIKIFDFSNKWDHDFTNLEVVDISDEINFSKRKIGYQFWRQKYVRALDIDTDYGMYVDTDTVMVNDNLDQLCGFIGDEIGSARHWWVPNFEHFRAKGVPPQNVSNYEAVRKHLKIDDLDPFYAGGVFLFRNNDTNTKLMQKVIDVYDEIYTEDSEYISGITDEVFFSGVCRDVIDLGGALNHCCMGDEHMDLDIVNGTFVGKNKYEPVPKPITFFHCDISRRDPSENYTGEMQDRIRELYDGCLS